MEAQAPVDLTAIVLWPAGYTKNHGHGLLEKVNLILQCFPGIH
jgi:hypothetical protein